LFLATNKRRSISPQILIAGELQTLASRQSIDFSKVIVLVCTKVAPPGRRIAGLHNKNIF